MSSRPPTFFKWSPSQAPHAFRERCRTSPVIQLRGRVVPVIDLRARFGLSPAAPSIDSRVVVVELMERTVGLLADSAREVIKLAPEQMLAPPRLLGDGAGFVKAVAHVGKRLFMLIDFAKVVGEEPIDVN